MQDRVCIPESININLLGKFICKAFLETKYKLHVSCLLFGTVPPSFSFDAQLFDYVVYCSPHYVKMKKYMMKYFLFLFLAGKLNS